MLVSIRLLPPFFIFELANIFLRREHSFSPFDSGEWHQLCAHINKTFSERFRLLSSMDSMKSTYFLCISNDVYRKRVQYARAASKHQFVCAFVTQFRFYVAAKFCMRVNN